MFMPVIPTSSIIAICTQSFPLTVILLQTSGKNLPESEMFYYIDI